MTGFFAVLDDIAALMDDVAVMAKIATKKTAGVLGDDLAVGAETASFFGPKIELPVLWTITKGSFVNKLIILPFAFLLTAFAPQFSVLILLIGGIYLICSLLKKIMHTFFIEKHINEKIVKVISEEELLAIEKAKIKTTIITDFILSLEIIMIALGTVTGKPLLTQILVVTIIAIAATIGVYGIVALMVRMDDMGMKFIQMARGKSQMVKSTLVIIGKGLVWTLPNLIKLLAIIGTLAMLLVGGGMFVHNIHSIHDFLLKLPIIVSELLVGLIVGSIAYFIVILFKWVKTKLFNKTFG